MSDRTDDASRDADDVVLAAARRGATQPDDVRSDDVLTDDVWSDDVWAEDVRTGDEPSDEPGDDRPEWSDAGGDGGGDGGGDDGGGDGAPGGRSARGNPVARLVVLVVLLAAVVGGVVLGDRSSPVAPPRAVGGSADPAVVPPAGALSTAWYCAAGSADRGGGTDETVYVANLSTSVVRATVTVLPGGEDAPRARSIRLGAYERGRVRVGDVLATASPGVVVEVSGGQAVVEHEVRGPTDVAMGACSHEPARVWRFASGTTVKGSTLTLDLFNPYGDDAIVDVSFVTDAGTVEPSDVQGFVVERRSKARVSVTDLVPRQEHVAAIVRARTGRIVAEQVATADGTAGPAGVGVTLGVTRARRSWTLPFGASGSGTTTALVLANDALAPARVSVSVVLPGEGTLAPDDLVVPSRSVVVVEPGGRTGAFDGFALRVRSDRRIVADVTEAAGAGAEGRGTALAGPATRGSRRWALAGSPSDTATALTAVNLSGRPLTVEVRARTAGDPQSPSSAPAFAVPAGRSVRIDLASLGIRPDQVLEVVADGPIVVGREVYAPVLSASLAVPVAD